MTDTNDKVERKLVKIELSKYPSDEPICGFVVEDHIANATTTLLMATFADQDKQK